MKHAFILLSLLALSSCSDAEATHCPGCDSTTPDYNSSAWERRYDAGKYQEGNGQYPYRERESNIQRDNREREAYEQQRREIAERQRNDSYGNSRDGASQSYRGAYGGQPCRSLYGC